MKIAACVILYNPTITDVTNMFTYTDNVGKLYIMDNSEKDSHENLLHNIHNYEYFYKAENFGIAHQLNNACKKAIEDGFDLLLTMDQDSFFSDTNLKNYIDQVSKFETIDSVATFGLEYNSNDLDLVKKYIEVDHVITSGCIVNLKLFEKIGGFDDNLFIDYVDTEYCYNALSKGYTNIRFTNVLLNHSLGEIKKRKALSSFYLKSKRRTIHSNIRIYYMWRNLLYMEKKYGKLFPKYIQTLKKRQKKYIFRCINYSDNAWEAIKMYLKATKDFKNNKMGKIKL